MMRRRTVALAALLATIALHTPAAANEAGQRVEFNDDWRFGRDSQPGAEARRFEDSAWKPVSLPHDWAIEGPFDFKYNGRTGGLPVHGEGWYRKTFTVPDSARGKVVTIEFDGAMDNSSVWVNGQFVGKRPSGYVGFEYDISRFLDYGSENVIAVQLAPRDLSSRWYPGAGLYRDVWLEIDDPAHIDEQDSFITTPVVSAERAEVNVIAAVDREGDVDSGPLRMDVAILDARGRPVQKRTLAVGAYPTVETRFTLERPTLWDVDNPYLYTVSMTLKQGSKTIDTQSFPLGVRSIEYTSDRGFLLNGRRVQIQGVCLHHDNGPIGAVANRRAIERKLQIMKAMGVNSIRTSHNMPSPILVELADEMGLLLNVEAFDVWKLPKRGAEQSYNIEFDEWHERDLTAMVKQFRNHPSVIMWSLGNEVMEQSDKDGAKVTKMLHDIVKQHDTTRPTTVGFNQHVGAERNGLAAVVDIVGLNYYPNFYADWHKRYPNWILLGSETSSITSSRGTYHLPIEKYEKHPSWRVTSYDVVGPPWAYPPDYEWWQMAQTPAVIGEYIWTGFDYIGEPTPFSGRDNSTKGYWNDDWPARSSYFGAVDLSGMPKDRFYLYQSQWTTEPMVHLLPHWNWEGKEGQEIPVMVYTNGAEAELFLNGRSLGRKVKGKDLTPVPVIERYDADKVFESPYRLSWSVPYEPGELRVVAYRDGKPVAEKVTRTAGLPARIMLTPDRSTITADGDDLSYVTVEIQDKNGNPVPFAENMVRFVIEGEGTIAAVGNGDAATLEPFKADYRRAFNGKAMVILQSTRKAGTMKLRALSENLSPMDVTIATR